MKSNIIIRDTKVLSKTKSAVKLITYDMQPEGEMVVTKTTEMYDHGNAVAVLLYNESKKTILLTEQFRLPTYINGNKTGMLLEACAGIIDEGETPEETIKREIKEELGYVIENVEKVYEAYSSPGCLTELLTL